MDSLGRSFIELNKLGYIISAIIVSVSLFTIILVIDNFNTNAKIKALGEEADKMMKCEYWDEEPLKQCASDELTVLKKSQYGIGTN